jgi:transcriptional regulator with XRE-family HTH domain
MGIAAQFKPKRLPRKLAEIRESFGLSQGGIIAFLGFTDEIIREEISALERGRRQPPLKVLLQYARVAGVWVDVLIDDELDLPRKLPASPKHPGVKRSRKRPGRK